MKQKILTVTLNPSIDKTITLENINLNQLNRAIDTRVDPGGKGINVARVLQNLGIEVLATGLIAGDIGKKLLKALDNRGIANDFYTIQGETRTNLKLLDLSNHKITEINEPGVLISENDLNGFRKKYKSLLKQAEIIVLSGSLPPGIPVSFYQECIEIGKKNNKKVILDADGQVFIEGLKAIPFAIKPNLQELEVVAGKQIKNKGQIIEEIKKFISQGIELVIVSMGPEGAIIGNKHQILSVDTWNIDVKGATGAGDSMVAALIYSLQNQYSLPELAKMSVAAGTITASKVGTQICTLNEVIDSIENVKVHQVQIEK
jgi:1-phosphofructokinase